MPVCYVHYTATVQKIAKENTKSYFRMSTTVIIAIVVASTITTTVTASPVTNEFEGLPSMG
jgi:hypothetical protein